MTMGGIVTFEPDLMMLRQNLAAICPQVDRVRVVDNGSSNGVDIAMLCADFHNVTIDRLPLNRGVAVALNRVTASARADGATHVLLLDQDSVAESDMVAKLCMQSAPDVAIIAPRYVDRNLPSRSCEISPEVNEVNNCITSGSLVRIDAWVGIGGYDERLFVDFVDFDFSLRLRQAGWRILSIRTAVLAHEIGQSKRRSRFTAYNHSSFRSYHLARDMVVYSRKHRHSPRRLRINGRGTATTCLVLLRRAAIVALFEQNKAAKIAAILRGIAHGLVVRI
jgi:rhamnosyltransferase